jgi:lysophospholipase L1-like esterase
MPDNNNEGFDRGKINAITSFVSASIRQRPNVVLVHAGTNDLNAPLEEGQDIADAPSRLGTLIDTVLATCPDALVLVAQIIPSQNETTEASIVTFNAAIPGVVAARFAKGSKVMVVDMFTRLTIPDNYEDSLNPNDSGYDIMGDTWAYAIAYANNTLGWVSPPVAAPVEPELVTCASTPAWFPQGEVIQTLFVQICEFSLFPLGLSFQVSLQI